MIFDCRDERYGVWRQLRPGAHQLVSATLQSQPSLFELLSNRNDRLNGAVHLIVRFTSNCVGQLALLQKKTCEVDCRINPTEDSACVLQRLQRDVRREIADEIEQDLEFLTFWNGIWSAGTNSKDVREDLVSWTDYVGLIRLASRMAGCCIGQALALEKISLLRSDEYPPSALMYARKEMSA